MTHQIDEQLDAQSGAQPKAQFRARFSVVILAGGFGRRLGRDKATCAAAGRPLLHWTALAAAEATDDIVVVRREDQEFPPAPGAPWREVCDRRSERGPLAGLEAALERVAHDTAVLVACDMPLVRAEVLAAVADAAQEVEIAMPVVGGYAQPLLAAYRRSVAGHVRALLDEGEGRLRALLPLVEHALIAEEDLRRRDPQLESLTNVNRVEDLERVERILRTRAAPRGETASEAADAEEDEPWRCTDGC